MTGERVTKSRRKAQDEGRKRLSAILSADASERYTRLKERHGSEAALIEAALKALEGANELTNAEILATLAQRLNNQGLKTPATSGTLTPETRVPPDPVKGNQPPLKISTPPKR